MVNKITKKLCRMILYDVIQNRSNTRHLYTINIINNIICNTVIITSICVCVLRSLNRLESVFNLLETSMANEPDTFTALQFSCYSLPQLNGNEWEHQQAMIMIKPLNAIKTQITIKLTPIGFLIFFYYFYFYYSCDIDIYYTFNK